MLNIDKGELNIHLNSVKTRFMEFYVLIELRKEHSVVGLSDIYVEINKEFEDYSRKEKMETYKTKKMLLKKKKKKK